MTQALTYVEIDVDHCSLTYGVNPCRAFLGFDDGRPHVATFDGASVLARGGGLTGAADSKMMTVSVWLRIAPATDSGRIIASVTTLGGGTGGTRIVFNGGTTQFNLQGMNAALSTILNIRSSSLSTGVWHHCLASVDLANPANRHIYIDDVSDLATVVIYTNDTMDFTMADWGVGAYPNVGTPFTGDMADLWFMPGLYVDFSVTANRRKFISATGHPVDLGSDGSTPTGSAPLVYLFNGTNGANLGTGGGFTPTGVVEYDAIVPKAKKCFNTKATCQDTVSFTNVPATIRYAVDADYLPADVECIPSILNVDFTPSTISLGGDLGQRATVKVTFRDHPHSDTGEGNGDKYLSTRTYDPWGQGTYWGKFRARNPFLQGRPLRLIQGAVGQDLANMETRYYVMESFDGPTPKGEFSIVAKDILKLTDGDRSQAPDINTGSLLAGINASVTSATLTPTGIGNLEYAASGYLNIGGKEIVSYTRAADVLTITRAQLNTVASAHDAGERVQEVLRYVGQSPADILYDLLTVYAGVDVSFINLTDWQNEVNSFLNRLYTASIASPTSVGDLLSELIEQAGLVLYWDDSAQMIKLQVLRALAASGSYDADSIMEGSLNVTEQPTKRVSQVWTYYAQINPLTQLDNLENFQSYFKTVDDETEVNYGAAAIKKIFSRWIPTGGQNTVSLLNDLLISQYKNPPRRLQFDVMRYNAQVPVLAGGYYLSSWPFQDDTGADQQLSMQVTRVRPGVDRFSVEAEEMLFSVILGQSPDSPHIIVFDANTNDVNMRTVHDSLYPAPASGTVVRAIIRSGIVVGSSSTATPAFDVGSWPSGVDLTIQIDGRIQGHGGTGGNAPVGGGVPGSPGSVGGPALYTRYTTTKLEYGVDSEVWGGGGGGGGGGSTIVGGVPFNGNGGGGGSGTLPGDGGAHGPLNSYEGSPGTATAGGAGGAASVGIGGTGGAPGQAGATGSAGNITVGGAGGAAGAAIDGISHITTSGSGDVQGAQIN